MPLAYSRSDVAFYLLITAIFALSSALTPPDSASLVTSEYSPSDNLSSLIVINGSVDTSDGGTPQEIPVLSFNTTGVQYDVIPSVTSNAVICDGSSYGVNLDRSACDNAIARVGSDATSFSVAQRGLGRRPNVALPNRYSSCKTLLC